METMSLGIEAPVKVTGTLTEFDTSNVQDFLGTNNVENKSIADGFQSIPETIGNSTDEWKANTAIVKEFGNVMPEVIKSLRQMNDAVVRNTQNLPALKKQITSEDHQQKRIEQLNRQNFLGFFNTGSNMIQNAAHGNIGGSVISGASGVSTIMNNFSQMASASDMTGLAKSLLIGGGILTGGIAIAKGGKALADAYKDAMPTIFGTGKAFGTTDSDMSMALYKDVNKFNNGTNLDNAAFNSLVVNLRKQGVGNGLASPFAQAAEAGRIAETTAQWAYATGGDANQYANLAGIMSRYGGSTNVADDFNRLVSAGYASGLNDSQIPEFLSGIQKVMEDGIAKGFARSATEVADTMLMFSKLSGNNAFWQGEQGAKLINQASAGLAGATAMSKTTDLIAFGAINRAFSTPELMEGALGKNKDLYMKGSNYVNEMMILEQGLNKDNFGALMGGIYSTSADDDDRVEDIRSMFGLNYIGARRMQRLYEEYQNKGFDTATFESKLKEITDSPENQNDETAYRKSVNKIAEALQTMGQPVFNLELKGMTEIEKGVTKIANFLVPEANVKPINSDNPSKKVREESGDIADTYYENLAKVENDAYENLSEAEQMLLNARTKSTFIDSFGTGYNSEYDYVLNFDPSKQLWNSYDIVPTTIKDNKGFTKKGQEKWAAENHYKIKDGVNRDSVNPIDAILELSSATIASGLQGTTITGTALIDAMSKSEELKASYKKAAKDGIFSDTEIKSMNTILEKILAELKVVTITGSD